MTMKTKAVSGTRVLYGYHLSLPNLLFCPYCLPFVYTAHIKTLDSIASAEALVSTRSQEWLDDGRMVSGI